MSLIRPWGIAASQYDKVYVGDTQRSQVLVFDMVKQDVYVMGAGRYANLFSALMGVAVDSAGNIYASDSQKNQIYVFTKDEKPLINIGDDTLLSWPVGIVVDDERNRLYVANNHHHNIAVFDLSGKHLFNVGRRGKMPGYLNFPTDVDVDSKGNIVVADSMNARVQIFSPDGQYLKHFGKRGDGISDFEIIKGIAVDRATDNIYVTDGKGNDFKIFNSEGESLLSIGGMHSVKRRRDEAPGGFLLPQDIEIDKSGRIYVVDSLNARFQVFKIIDDQWLKEKPLKDFGTKIE
ncbi:MAG: 6-bladed beta-propeller [Deltaproteobacteria bacterium]|nr:6-bladed beta-propeller [Deltaproteobacteria bacterium]